MFQSVAFTDYSDVLGALNTAPVIYVDVDFSIASQATMPEEFDETTRKVSYTVSYSDASGNTTAPGQAYQSAMDTMNQSMSGYSMPGYALEDVADKLRTAKETLTPQTALAQGVAD